MSKQPDSARRADRLLTDLEACDYLRIRPRQLYTWRIQGLIPFIRIGRALRYRQSDLDRALDALTVGGAANHDEPTTGEEQP
jgi:excisionase family DNA binding protein